MAVAVGCHPNSCVASCRHRKISLLLALLFSLFLVRQWIDNYEDTTVSTRLTSSDKGRSSPYQTTIQPEKSLYWNHSTERKTALQALEWVWNRSDSEIDDVILPNLPQTFPKPTAEETIHIYNVSVWHQLRNILTTQKSITLCAIGGSVTAGSYARGGRYFVDFLRYFYPNDATTSYQHNVADQVLVFPNHDMRMTLLDRAHGARGSFHSALLSHWYFPPHEIDVLIWEFSINDDSWIVHPERRMAAEQKAFETWLDAISQLNRKDNNKNKPPPLVLLVYLWSTPFQLMDNTTIVDRVFESHQTIGAKYDFVVGHIQVGSYIGNDLQWGETTSRDVLLSDAHHLNRLGHGLVGFLLWEFLQYDEARLERAAKNAPALRERVSNLTGHWSCDHEGAENEQPIVQLMETSQRSIASWTMDYPYNSQVYPGMLQIQNQTAFSSKLLGKQSEWRVDRQRAILLPCCHDSTSVLEFTLPSMMPMDITAVHLGIPSRKNGEDEVSIFFDDQDVSGQQTKIHGKYENWERFTPGYDCLGWTMFTLYDPWFWVLVTEPQQNVSSIRLCSNNAETCGNAEYGTMVQTLLVF
jgi:hypothetical protein